MFDITDLNAAQHCPMSFVTICVSAVPSHMPKHDLFDSLSSCLAADRNVLHLKGFCNLGDTVHKSEERIVHLLSIVDAAATNRSLDVIHSLKANDDDVGEIGVFRRPRFTHAVAHDAEHPVKDEKLQRDQHSKSHNISPCNKSFIIFT
jgi:hypothetical protein